LTERGTLAVRTEKNRQMRASSARLASRSVRAAGIALLATFTLTVSAAPPEDTHRARLDAVVKDVRARKFDAALAALKPLIPEIARTGDRALLAEALIQQAQALFSSARYPESFATYERALAAARAAEHRRFEARSIWGMAQVSKNQGRYPEALRLNSDARERYAAIADAGGEMRAWMLEGALLDLTGEHRPALRSYKRALAMQSPDEPNYGLIHSEMAISHKRLGEYEEARALYLRALEINRRIGFRYGEANALHQLSALAAELGDYDRALALAEDSLTMIRSLGDRRGEVYVLGSLGAFRWQQEDAARATAAYERQLELAKELDIRQPQVTALEGLGTIALATGDYTQARKRFDQALAIERASEGGDEGSLLVALAAVELRDANAAAAAKLAARALDLGRADEDPEIEWQARLALGRAARAGRDPATALAHLRAGVDVVNSVRGGVLTDTGKVGYLDVRQDLFHELAGTLMQESRAMEALEAAEAARGRAFSDLLAGKARQNDAAARPLLAQLRATEDLLRAQAGNPGSDPVQRAELTRTRAATIAKLDAQRSALRDERRELASLVVAEPVSAAEIRATAARMDATLVEYLVSEARLYAWVVHPSGELFAAEVPLERSRLRETVRQLHAQLNGLDAAALRNPEPVRKLLRQLHGWVVAPIAAHLPRTPDAHVVLVPHDVLLMVPFAALEDSAGRPLLAAHTLVSAPSIATLRYTADKKRGAKRLQGAKLLALADPVSPPDAAMDALPGARMEVRGISRRFATDRRLTLEGAQASEANAKRLSAGSSVLHFAVHGLVRDDRPWDSALLLSPGDGEDGWLRVSELFDLELAADLVVLSGCSTGSGKLSGDGILGLGRAFIYAGTPSVLVSQWDVSDVSTAYLMDRFYAELAAGRTKAQALRGAQLATQKRYAHPALWAAFVLIGEPQ
jgi:CHAT domain-containing protein